MLLDQQSPEGGGVSSLAMPREATHLIVQRSESGGVALLKDDGEWAHGACPAEFVPSSGLHLGLHCVQGEEVLQVEGSLVLLQARVGAQVRRVLEAEITSHLLLAFLFLFPFKCHLPEVAGLALRSSNQLLVRVEGGEGKSGRRWLLEDQFLVSEVKSRFGEGEKENLDFTAF